MLRGTNAARRGQGRSEAAEWVQVLGKGEGSKERKTELRPEAWVQKTLPEGGGILQRW